MPRTSVLMFTTPTNGFGLICFAVIKYQLMIARDRVVATADKMLLWTLAAGF